MEIRAVTAGHRQNTGLDRDAVEAACQLADETRQRLERAGYPVQTLRLATQPISEITGDGEEAVAFAQRLEAAARALDVGYCSVGPIVAPPRREVPALIEAVAGILAATEGVFVSVMCANLDSVNTRAARMAADALVEIGQLDDQGAASRRFAIGANVPPNGPFFPTGYHDGGPSGFSLALEAANLAVDAFTGASSFDEALDRLTVAIEGHGERIEAAVAETAAKHGAVFHGMDISLAPFPDAARSIAGAIERLGVGRFGAGGTLFASAMVADALRSARVRRCGFSGLMLPILEDSALAERHREGSYSIGDLLTYSAVCGTGLDTVPVAGDVTAEQAGRVYLDVCALSVRLRKPLTVRLMPIRGKRAGDLVTFDFPYFAPTTVARLPEIEDIEDSDRLFDMGDWTARGG